MKDPSPAVAHVDNGPKWNSRFRALAQHAASWSKDPSTKTGAVLLDAGRRMVAVGYNGLVPGIADALERLSARPIKYPLTAHGERNALLNAARSVMGFALSTWPSSSCTAGSSRCRETLSLGAFREVFLKDEGDHDGRAC